MDRSRVNRQLAVAVPKVLLTGHNRAFAGDRQAPIVKRQSSRRPGSRDIVYPVCPCGRAAVPSGLSQFVCDDCRASQEHRPRGCTLFDSLKAKNHVDKQ